VQKDARNSLTQKSSIFIITSMKKNTLTLTELAKYTGRKKRTLYNMIKDGRFPVEPIPGTSPRLWNTKQVDEWLGLSV